MQSFHLVLHNMKSLIKTFVSKFKSFSLDQFLILIETFGLQIMILMIILNFLRNCLQSFFFELFLLFLSRMSLNHSTSFFQYLQSLQLKILSSFSFNFFSLKYLLILIKNSNMQQQLYKIVQLIKSFSILAKLKFKNNNFI